VKEEASMSKTGSIALMVVLGCHLAAEARQFGKSKPIAVINGEAISREEWETAVKRLPAPPPTISAEQKKAAGLQVLAMMIDDVLLKQFVCKQAASPLATSVQQRMTQLETALRSNRKTLQDYLRETGLTEAKIRSGIASELQWQAFLEKRISQGDLKKFYDDNKEMFDGVKIRVSHIVMTIQPGDVKAEAQAKATMDAVRLELLKGADFATLARQYSSDKTSGEKGGDLGWFPPRKADPDTFIRTASSMKVGDVSGLVRTDYGLHIIKIMDYQPGKSSTFEEMKDSVKDVFADELKVSIILQQRREAKIEVND
jgi:parvulin-like peptidyl-prolyl isomerase